MSSTVPIFIVGAGPAGLVMALSLVKNGIKVRIIDRSETFHTGSRGFGLQPRTFELMQTLGILPDVQKLATDIPTMRAYKLPGGTEPVKTWDLYEKTGVWPDRPFANGACLSQSVLEEVIRTHLANHDTYVELGKELVKIEQDANGVTATILDHKASGASETQETVRAGFLVGADGAKGSTRKLLGLTFQGETRDADGMVWGDVEIRGLTTDYWHIWGKPGHFTIMARPLSPTGHAFGVGITGQNFDPTDLAEPIKVQQFVHEQTGRTDLQFGNFSWLSYFKPNMRMVNKFNEGRAFVVGDAAHVHSPTGGQGVNCSVQDSSNLAWKLALVYKNLADAHLLSSFTTERLPVITQMLHATTALYTHTVAKIKTEGEADKKEDDKASGWFRWRNAALAMYGINYRYSDIVLEERDTTPVDEEDMKAHAFQGYEGLRSLRAGDRAPDAPGLILSANSDTETSLFGIFKPSLHTVLIFGSKDIQVTIKAVVKELSTYPKEAVQTVVISRKEFGGLIYDVPVFVDRDGHAHTAYLIEEGAVNIVVVRPDAFIGAIVLNAEGVGRYFAKIINASG